MVTSWKLTGDSTGYVRRLWKEAAYFANVAREAGIANTGIDLDRPATIRGGLAARLGFQPGDGISESSLLNLLSGKDAAGNSAARPHKVNGIDLTFSAPKSVSLAALLIVRDPKIIGAHEQAVQETMLEIEGACAGTRPAKDTAVRTGNMVYALVSGGLNAAREPHLYTHAVLANMTAYKTRVFSLDGQLIMRLGFNHAWGAKYRARLGVKLSALGFPASKIKGDQWRLDVVAPEIEGAFSSRTREIQAETHRGVSDIWAREKTRREHSPGGDAGAVFRDWQKRLSSRAHGAVEGQGA